jgi:hypothetical protein
MGDTEGNALAAANEVAKMKQEMEDMKASMKAMAEQAADATNTVKVLALQASVAKSEARKSQVSSAIGIIKSAAGRRSVCFLFSVCVSAQTCFR